MPASWEVWGISFDHFAAPCPRHLTVEQIAGHYAECIRSRWSDDVPTVLVGWSMGGTIAAQMALELGDHCPELVLLDSVGPGSRVDVGGRSGAAGFDLAGEQQLIGGYDPGLLPHQRVTDVEELWREVSARVPATGAEAELVAGLARTVSPDLAEDVLPAGGRASVEQFNTLRTLIGARNTYRPCGTVPRGLVIEATDGESTAAHSWSGLLPEQMTQTSIEGNHYSIMMADAGLTAGIISDYLDSIMVCPCASGTTGQAIA
ncbi:alpha/beta fold hydrolase [Acidipropionibacterium jensenii]|uniref:thioesterase domain-containing protein n=1 Tax=Acidipropionibacterium jensenii TaxID=1749 RepID=UPI003452D987